MRPKAIWQLVVSVLIGLAIVVGLGLSVGEQRIARADEGSDTKL